MGAATQCGSTLIDGNARSIVCCYPARSFGTLRFQLGIWEACYATLENLNDMDCFGFDGERGDGATGEQKLRAGESATTESTRSRCGY
jgi:hypothetical protein